MSKVPHKPSDDENRKNQEQDISLKGRPLQTIDIAKAATSKPAPSEQPPSAVEQKGSSTPVPSEKPTLPPGPNPSPRIESVSAVEFSPLLPANGPMRKFVDKATSELGLPQSHAWSLWIFVTMAYSSHKLYHDDGCVERRMSPNIILAGDDESGLVRRLAVEVLNQSSKIEVLTNPDSLQTEEILEDFSNDVRRAVVDTGDDHVFTRWHKKASKQEISLAQLFNADTLNDYLSEKFRAKELPAAGVPILLNCELKDILSDRKFPFCVFRDSLVIPSFGCQKQRACSGAQMEELLQLLADARVEFPEEVFLSLTKPAQDELNAHLKSHSKRLVSLKQEGGHSHYRRSNMTHHILALASAYGIDASGNEFDGKISKSLMLTAINAFDKLDSRWDEIDDYYEMASRADEEDHVCEMIAVKLPNFYDERFRGYVVTFKELAKAFCHHPDREGQFTTGYFERKILPTIVASGRAKQIPSNRRRDRKWVFYDREYAHDTLAS